MRKDGEVGMIIKIETPKECMECVFCSEFCYCLLMQGEPTHVWEDGKRAEFCPFDNKASWKKIDKQVKIIEEE